MSIVLVEAELRQRLTSCIVGGWPIKWPNEPWPAGVNTQDGNLPINADGTPQSCAIVEFLTGDDTATIGAPGNRLGTLVGTMRVYLLAGQNTGTLPMQTQIDAIRLNMKRQTPYANPAGWERLTTMDPRVDQPLPGVETGDRYVRMVSVPWYYDYRN